jgi:hypothetical protein
VRDYGDISGRLSPLCAVMREQRKKVLHMTGLEFAEAAGAHENYTYLMESRHGLRNPTLGKLVQWVETAQAQEFGLYVVLNDVYTDVPLIEGRK